VRGTQKEYAPPSFPPFLARAACSARRSNCARVHCVRASALCVTLCACMYVARMNESNEELKLAWAAEQRVRALKMAISCAKMLGDASVPHFYPTAFVLATEILDTFGDLVFERIKSKGMVRAP